MIKVGTPVVFCKTKHSTDPGPRARDIHPSAAGEDYSYFVDKLWIVFAVNGDELVLQTRRGKTHTVRANDPKLRRASWWERLIYRGRFPKLESSETARS